MQISSSYNQYYFPQQRATTNSNGNSSANAGADTFSTVISSSVATQRQQQPGFSGSSRAALETALANGGVNVLDFLTSSDMDLIQRTTGVTIKNGGYYDSNGNQLGIRTDSHGNYLDPDPSQTKAAFDLAHTLSDLRNTGGIQGDTSLQYGRNITTNDLEAYLKGYAAALASDQKNVYVPNADVIKQAEKILTSERG